MPAWIRLSSSTHPAKLMGRSAGLDKIEFFNASCQDQTCTPVCAHAAAWQGQDVSACVLALSLHLPAALQPASWPRCSGQSARWRHCLLHGPLPLRMLLRAAGSCCLQRQGMSPPQLHCVMHWSGQAHASPRVAALVAAHQQLCHSLCRAGLLCRWLPGVQTC